MVFFIIICCQLQNYGTIIFSSFFSSFFSSDHSCDFCHLFKDRISSRSYNLFLFHSFCFFLYVRSFVCFFFTSFTGICYRPNFILWMPFTIFFMSMVQMFVKSLVFAEVIPTTLTLGREIIFSLFLIFLLIMISSEHYLISFTLNFLIWRGFSLLLFFFAISSSSINLVIAFAFIQVFSLISMLCCLS